MENVSTWPVVAVPTGRRWWRWWRPPTRWELDETNGPAPDVLRATFGYVALTDAYHHAARRCLASVVVQLASFACLVAAWFASGPRRVVLSSVHWATFAVGIATLAVAVIERRADVRRIHARYGVPD